ncbi:hypothetical protein CCZ27_07530 [Thauera sinica]|nr:hypothetical protein CCZ27_07530 [Thauera sp. K11]
MVFKFILALLTNDVLASFLMKWNVQWSDWNSVFERNVATSNEAFTLLDEVRDTAKIPAIVEFFNHEGVSLGIGIGREKTVLTFQKSNDPPYFISIGESNSSGTTTFCYGTEESEYLERNLVDLDSGFRAVQEFLLSGEMPRTLQWEML